MEIFALCGFSITRQAAFSVLLTSVEKGISEAGEELTHVVEVYNIPYIMYTVRLNICRSVQLLPLWLKIQDNQARIYQHSLFVSAIFVICVKYLHRAWCSICCCLWKFTQYGRLCQTKLNRTWHEDFGLWQIHFV